MSRSNFVEFPGLSETNNMKLLFFVLIPSVCVFLGIVNILYNSLMIAVYIRIKPWKSPILLTYFNILLFDVIASLGAVSMYSIRLFLYKHNRSHLIMDLTDVVYSTEIFSVFASLMSTILLVTLRVIALSFPFFFRNQLSVRRVLPFLFLPWIVGATMVYLDIKMFFQDYFLESIWATFVAMVTVTLVIALLSLLPLWRSDQTYRPATNSIVLLALLNFLCYGGFGAFNLAQAYICGNPNSNPSLDLLRFFCNIETFYSVIFIFPTVYSLGNVVVISRGELAKEVLRNWTLSIRSCTSRVLSRLCRESGGSEEGDRHQLHPGVSGVDHDTTTTGDGWENSAGVGFENRCNSQV